MAKARSKAWWALVQLACMYVSNTESLVASDGPSIASRGSVSRGKTSEKLTGFRFCLRETRDDLSNGLSAVMPVEHLRGGSGLAKKIGAKNFGLLLVLLSILYAPSSMTLCSARMVHSLDRTQKPKIQRLGCSPLFIVNNIVTLSGLTLVLMNSRKFDRYGRSKFKMRLTGSIIIFTGMMLVVAHAETARLTWYSKFSTYLGLMLEWWGFASLFYNFTPKLIAQLPREFSKFLSKLGIITRQAEPADWADPQSEQRREADRLNQWAQAQARAGPPPAAM